MRKKWGIRIKNYKAAPSLKLKKGCCWVDCDESDYTVKAKACRFTTKGEATASLCLENGEYVEALG